MKKWIILIVPVLIGASLASGQTITRCGGPANALYINSPMFHFDVCRTGNNPYEHTLSPSTVANLVKAWSFPTRWPVTSSPALVNGVVYFGSADGNVYALNANTGGMIWKSAPGGAFSSSPAVANGVVYIGSDANNFFALNAHTGALLWKYATPSTVDSSPVVADGIVYFTSYATLYALNASTGAFIWSGGLGGQAGNNSPAIVNGVAYAGSLAGTVKAMNARTGALIWGITGSNMQVSGTPAVINGVVYVVGTTSAPPNQAGFVRALDALSGAQLWEYDLPLGDDQQIRNAPAVANGVLYFISNNYLWALDATTGAFLWQSDLFGYRNVGSPTVANGVVYLGTDVVGFTQTNAFFEAHDAKTGAQLWYSETNESSSGNLSVPVVANGMFFAGSGDGNLYAFHLPGQ